MKNRGSPARAPILSVEPLLLLELEVCDMLGQSRVFYKPDL